MTSKKWPTCLRSTHVRCNAIRWDTLTGANTLSSPGVAGKLKHFHWLTPAICVRRVTAQRVNSGPTFLQRHRNCSEATVQLVKTEQNEESYFKMILRLHGILSQTTKWPMHDCSLWNYLRSCISGQFHRLLHLTILSWEKMSHEKNFHLKDKRKTEIQCSFKWKVAP